MRSILVVPRVASGPSGAADCPAQGSTEIRMSAGPKENPENTLSPLPRNANPDRPAPEVRKDIESHVVASSKDGKQERKVEFAQGTIYRQGIRVPNGPNKSPVSRGRNK
ncbi:MAG TPA: hypothetical protein VKD04_00460 [Burkholderiales bacterium]|nr:hypothetical protein [Burkholderiales bacterium]